MSTCGLWWKKWSTNIDRRPRRPRSHCRRRSTNRRQCAAIQALFARVSSNLLSNALRYTPAGGHVHVARSSAGGDGAVLAVEDTGCGIPAEDQDKVFERFFRADKARSRAQGGNGLGLAICKSLVEAHHGTIGFKSAPDRGTRFEVRLPLAGPPAPIVANH